MTEQKPPQQSRTKMYVGWGLLLAATAGLLTWATQ